jgi:protein TonB
MKKTLLLICLATSAVVANAQQSTPKSGDPNAEIKIDAPVTTSENNTQIFTAVEQEPSFPGGMEQFYRFLQTNIRYPAKAFENNVQGKVFLTFVVEKDGSLTDIKVVRGIGSGCDEEARRVFTISPKWKPGIQNGRPVRVQYTMPVSFSLAKK